MISLETNDLYQHPRRFRTAVTTTFYTYLQSIPYTPQQETKPRKRHFEDSGGGDHHISDNIHSTYTTKTRPKAVTLDEVRDSERSQNINRPLNLKQPLSPEMVGFPNRGLTCYMNAVLQVKTSKTEVFQMPSAKDVFWEILNFSKKN